jgi:Ca2+/Na+ antiporter
MPHKNKKQAKENAQFNQIMFGSFCVAHLFFAFTRLFSGWDTVGKLLLMGYICLIVSSTYTMRAIYTTREKARVNDIKANQIGVEYHFDVFCLSIFVLLGGSFSDYFWLILLLIPGYVFYIGGKWVINWVFTPSAAELEAQDARRLSQLKNQERKARKQKNRRR